MNNRPSDLEEYLKLKFEYEGCDIRHLLDNIDRLDQRVEIENDWERYKELEPWAEKLLKFKAIFLKRQEEKDEVFERLKKMDLEMSETKRMEKAVAANITEDHEIAEEQKKSLGDIFPKLRLFYCVSFSRNLFPHFFSYL